MVSLDSGMLTMNSDSVVFFKILKVFCYFFADCVFYVSPDYFLSVDFVYLINIAI